MLADTAGCDRSGEGTNDASFIAGKAVPMLYYAIVFALIAVMAGTVGFVGTASTAAAISRVIFIASLVLSAASLVLAIFRRRRSA